MNGPAKVRDIVVVGGTPGGIAAAITAARLGRSVVLVEYLPIIGGMMTNGLGKSDVETREAIGGLFREFVERVRAYYVKTYGLDHENVKLCRDGYYYEPSVAARILDEMIGESPNVEVLVSHRVDDVLRLGNRLIGIQVKDLKSGARSELRANAFIDATYEGDLAACAGVKYRSGREARSDFNELHAGVVYMDYETGAFLPGTTGEGDRRLQAYTFRLCLTDVRANSRILTDPPPDYDRTHYLGYIDDWKQGRMGPPREMRDGMGYFAPTFNTVVRALSLAEIPNGKFDVNINPRPLGFPFCEENYDYPAADCSGREKIMERIRNLTLGLLYFLQNDPEIPEEHRKLARTYNLTRDEFPDNNGFPWQLYVREARRIIGEYTLSEHDVFVGPELGRTRIHADSIAAGEFPIDSFPVRKREQGHDVALEGYILMLDKLTHPYQIPYRIIVPGEIEGLLVPVAASTTHVAFSTIRLEPTWMALGQAAGVAAHLAIDEDISVRAVDVDVLQRLLLDQGQVITFFKDIDQSEPAYAALQYFGTRGFFTDYYARAHELLDRSTAGRWLDLAQGGDGAHGADFLDGDGWITRGELCGILKSGGLDGRFFEASPDQPVTRGEFCRTLYQAMFENKRRSTTLFKPFQSST